MDTQRLLLALSLLLANCSASTIDTEVSDIGTPSSYEELITALDSPGEIQFEKHLMANWSVPLSGLLNLDHPKSQAAGLADREEAIQIYAYSLVHPKFGTFLVDSGVASSFASKGQNNGVNWIVESAMNMDALEVVKTSEQLDQQLGGVDGIFLTHIHLDHIMGLPDFDNAKVYAGPGDTALSSLMNLFTQGSTNRLLATTEKLREWQFDDRGVIDVFGDGSFWALHTPGHTPGATAYLAMTVEGPELMIGDATHTSWGWRNGVEPGTYSADIPESAKSLEKLIALAISNSSIAVHPGHQSL